MNTIKLNTIGEAPVKKVAGGGGGNYVYYNKSSDGNLTSFLQFASVGKVVMNDITGFMSAIQIVLYKIPSDNILALGFDRSLKITDGSTLKLVAIGETLDAIGIDLPQITEEEFYKMPLMLTIQIYDETKLYIYEEGMTWGEWVNSEYSKGEFKLKDCGDYQEIRHIASYGDIAECFDTGCYNVKDSDLIYNKTYKCLTPPV